MSSTARRMTQSSFESSPESALEAVRQGESVDITSRGKVVATISPAGRRRLGCMAGTAQIVGDIVAPLDTWNTD